MEDLSIYDDQDRMRQQAEMVPLSVLKQMRDYERRPGEAHAIKTPERYEALKQHIDKHGITSPVWIDYHPEKGIGHISEGNHRLAIAEDLGMSHVPAVVFNSRRTARGMSLPLTYKGPNSWDGYPPQYMRPSDFPELQSSPNPDWKLSAYEDFIPQGGQPEYRTPEWDEHREEFLPREGGQLGAPPTSVFWGEDQNHYNWEHGQDGWGHEFGHPDHVDENLQPEHWKDNFVGKDTRHEWMNPMDALRDHHQHLYDQHGAKVQVHPEWNDTHGPSDNAQIAENTAHIRPVTNRVRYLVGLHELGHLVGGHPSDMRAGGLTSYGPHRDSQGNELPGRHPLDYTREYKPQGWNLHDDGKYIGPMGEDPSDLGFKYPHEWELTKKELPEGVPEYDDYDEPPHGFFPGDEMVTTSPYTEEENKLETEARAWDWAIQHSAVKITPELLRQMYRYLGSYADPKAISNYSPTFKRLWNEGEHPEEGWHDPNTGDWAREQRERYYQKHDTIGAAERHAEWMDDNSWNGFKHPDYNANPYHMVHPDTGEERWFEQHHPQFPYQGDKPPIVAGYRPYVPSKAPVSRSKTILANLRVVPPLPPVHSAEGDTERQTIERVKQALAAMPELRKGDWADQQQVEDLHPLHGHCYVGSEALYHLLGGKEAGYTPMQQDVNGSSHWWLRGPNGVLDPTAEQFNHPVDYEQGVGRGFLTRQPSKRTQKVLDAIQGRTASGADHDGAMVALMLRKEDADKLHVRGGEPAKDMHITLVFFEDKGADRADWDRLHEPLANIAREYGKLEGEVGGTGSFAEKDGKEPFFATPDVPHLAELHMAVKDACEQAGFPVSTEHGFNPHITLMYRSEGQDTPLIGVPSPLEFDELTLMVGGDPEHFKFEGENVKTSDWHEEDHPREGQTGKFAVKRDQHALAQHDKKGKLQGHWKRCKHCGVLYAEPHNQEIKSCPTCGSHPQKESGGSLHQLRPMSANPQAIADSLGWRYWKTNNNGHKMYQWTDPETQVPHTVTGYGDHGDQDWHGQKVRKMMNQCMGGTCAHAFPNMPTAPPVEAPLHDAPGAPVLRAGQEVTYGGQNWWVVDVQGNIAHIYDDTGREDMVAADQLKAASWA